MNDTFTPDPITNEEIKAKLVRILKGYESKELGALEEMIKDEVMEQLKELEAEKGDTK